MNSLPKPSQNLAQQLLGVLIKTEGAGRPKYIEKFERDKDIPSHLAVPEHLRNLYNFIYELRSQGDVDGSALVEDLFDVSIRQTLIIPEQFTVVKVVNESWKVALEDML